MRIPNYKRSEAELVQAKEGFEPGKWWAAFDSEGRLLAETSSRSDFKELGLDTQEGVTFHRLYERKETKWVEDNPFTEEEN